MNPDEIFQPADPDAWKGDEANSARDKIFYDFNKMMERRAAEKAGKKKAGVDFNSFIQKGLKHTWVDQGVVRYLTKHETMGHWCGYARFPTRPVKVKDYKGILTYVPVHGGITWAEDSPDGSFVYGFDCAHASDDCEDREPFEKRMARFKRTGQEKDLLPGKKPRRLEWLKAQVEIMILGIQVAARYEDAYVADESVESRSKVLEHYHKYLHAEAGKKFELDDNFGAMLNVLCGKL